MRDIGNMKINYDFAITTFCQAKCRSCTRTDPDSPTGETSKWLTPHHMNYDVFKNILSGSRRLKDNNKYIQFCGELGDPMMHPRVNDFIETALEYGNKVHVNTNGGLRQPKWYEYLAQKYSDDLRIKFGVDGIDHDTNWLYREGVDFDRAMRNMKAYFGAGGEGEWHFIIFDWNWHQIPAAKRIATEEIGCEIFFKFNGRDFGKIRDENKEHAYKLLIETQGEILP